MAYTDNSHLVKELKKFIPAPRLRTSLIDRVAFANDAGFYKLTPLAVVMPESVDEVKKLFEVSHRLQVPITFRTGGTSLSGQSITDGILVELSQYWRKILPENDGKQVRVQPGAIGAMVNAYLKKHHAKMGPDPSSIASAMMGGILSNNSSGMCCGVANNSYHTLKYISFLLPTGDFYSTENEADYARFQNSDLGTGIIKLREKILSNDALTDKIRKKYLTKNTVGYSLNAFLDFSDPLDIFAHLLIGAEGTLAFISEAVLNTVPDYPYKSTALLYFNSISDACHAIVPLRDSGAEAIELMDRASLRSVENIKGMPPELKSLPSEAAALLIEYQDDTKEKISQKVEAAKKLIIDTLKTINAEIEFTEDAKKQALLWKVRKGMFPSVGAVRAQGTTVILEDVAFPVAQMATAITDLQTLFTKYNYDNAIIFGHAKDGNIHFVVTQTFNEAKEISRYEAFMNDVVDLVVKKYDGALKAEHGTGRNMAPFVEAEWGGDAYQIMHELKQLTDPLLLLNPGVIINEDKQAHLKNLKKLPVVEQEIDKCIECGACEPKCPSRDLTLSPRRRIVVRREMATLKAEGNKKDFFTINNDFQYQGLETCAVDGMCATDCPVDINTGDLVKRLRKENHSEFQNKMAKMLAKNFGATYGAVKLALAGGETMNKLFGKGFMYNSTAAVKKVVPSFPLWSKEIISSSTKLTNTKSGSERKVVYFSSCICKAMGGSKDGQKNINEVFYSLCAKANVEIVVPENSNAMCCGQPFSSKGFADAFEEINSKSLKSLWEASNHGAIPVVMDLSSCTQTLINSLKSKPEYQALKIYDSIDFLRELILPHAKIGSKKSKIALHPVCSLSKMGLNDAFTQVASALSTEVFIPKNAGCCGMAGDRGFLFPELTASATQWESKEVAEQKFEGYYCSSKTCEMALSTSTGQNYLSLLHLADEVLV